MLIDCSYFSKGSRRIHNSTLGKIPNNNGVEVVQMIEAFICEHQEAYLRKMLGGNLGNKVNAYLVCLQDDEEPKHNENFDALCEHLRESFADYVFFHFLRDTVSQSTITGLVRIKNANEYVPPIRRQVNIWNTMVDKHNLFVSWCRSEECSVKGISISKDMLAKINQFNL